MKVNLLELIGVRRAAGVHPPGFKVTADRAIERAPLPDRVVLPMSQHIGAPAKPVVKAGDEVLVGQLIAEGCGGCSANIHATISGVVKPLTTIVSPTSGGPVPAIIIEGDGEDRWIDLEPADPEKLSAEEIVARISAAGIIGMGGAAFPTHLKVNRPPDSPVHTLLVNGAECEPYITSDDRLMSESSDRILDGIRILMRLLSVQRVVIGIEDNKPDAIAAMSRAVNQAKLTSKVEVSALPAKYPMGAEKTMIRAVLGVEVPEGSFPTDKGIVVQNVATLAAIADAVMDSRPLVERVVTVTGHVGNPSNLIVRFGASAQWVIDQCGGMLEDADSVLFGGPMMGIAQPTLDAPLVKSTNCILVKKADLRVERNCVRCGRCVQACPMSLMPLMFVNHVKKGMIADLSDYHLFNCVECGACSYDCPANIPIVSYIKVGKSKLRQLGGRS